MLWYKSWLETRWRFLIGLIVLMCSAAGVVIIHPKLMKLMPLAPDLHLGGELGRQVREALELARDYHGYIWLNWFRQNLSQLGTLFAILLGTGGLLSQPSGSAALFTLSLPASRNRLLGVRAAFGLAELFVLAFVPSLVIPLLSPAVGESYGVGSALMFGIGAFFGMSVFFALAFLLSTFFIDLWRPLLIALGVAITISIAEQFSRHLGQHYGIFHLMHGETYFRTGELPWTGLVASAALSAALYFIATRNMVRRDF